MCHLVWHGGLFLPSYSCRNICTFLALQGAPYAIVRHYRYSRDSVVDQCSSEQLRTEQRKLHDAPFFEVSLSPQLL